MGVKSWFNFNNQDSRDFDVTIEHYPNYPVAERIVEFIHVDGRNGDYIRDTGAYANVTETYSIYFHQWQIGEYSAVREVATWLNGSTGYCRLSDSYDPRTYRMAVMNKYTEYKSFHGKVYQVDVEFSCKPQRYILGGDQPVSIADGRIHNDYMPCYPLLRVVGNGDITIGGNTISVRNNANKTMYIDTETQDAYSGYASGNNVQTWKGPYTRERGGNTAKFNVTKFNPNDYLEIYLSYTASIPNTRTDQWSHTIVPSVAFSWTYNVGGAFVDGAYTITKAAENNQIVFTTATSGASMVNEIVLSDVRVSAVSNRNGDIVVLDEFPHVPTGGTTVTYTTTSLEVIPRWWTL